VKFEEAEVKRVTGQYLYRDVERAYFMDTKTYEQYSIKVSEIEDKLKLIKEGSSLTLVIFNDQLIGLDLPKSIVLEVVHAEPAVRGDTTTTPMKKVKLETGYEIEVPLFINKGDKVKINTETGKYVCRVK
jgi:elongation factor P